MVTTGVGLSGGPARLLAARLSQLGLPARFVPLSGLHEISGGEISLAVLFSQSLSPNARLALQLPARRKVCFTGVNPAGSGSKAEDLRRFLGVEGRSVLVPTEERHRRLVRVQSPAVSSFLAFRWVASAFQAPSRWTCELQEVPARCQRAFMRAGVEAQPRPDDGPLIFVTEGRPSAELHHLAFKWAEGTFAGLPPILDVLELVHGPLQTFFDDRRCVVALGLDEQAPLLGRLRDVLDADRHRLLAVSAEGAAPLDLFEFDAVLNAWLADASWTPPSPWPGQGRDEALYAWAGDH